jgi:hypothetical protein
VLEDAGVEGGTTIAGRPRRVTGLARLIEDDAPGGSDLGARTQRIPRGSGLLGDQE